MHSDVDATEFSTMSSTHGTAIIAADAVFMAVAAAAVGLRFYVRKRSAMALAADDWLALVAWVCPVCYEVFTWPLTQHSSLLRL